MFCRSYLNRTTDPADHVGRLYLDQKTKKWKRNYEIGNLRSPLVKEKNKKCSVTLTNMFRYMFQPIPFLELERKVSELGKENDDLRSENSLLKNTLSSIMKK